MGLSWERHAVRVLLSCSPALFLSCGHFIGINQRLGCEHLYFRGQVAPNSHELWSPPDFERITFKKGAVVH